MTVVSNHQFTFPQKLHLVLTILLWCSVRCAIQANAQAGAVNSSNSTVNDDRPVQYFNWPESIAGKWKAKGPAHNQSFNQLQPNIPPEIYTEYGVREVSSRTYTSKSENYTVETFQLRFPSEAYGLFTYFQHRLLPNQQQFQRGRYLVRIQRTNSTTKTALEKTDEFVVLFRQLNEAQPFLPILVEHLPQTNKLAASETYILGPKALAQDKHFSFLATNLGFEGGTEAVSTEYQLNSNAMGMLLIEFQNPQLASGGYTRIQAALSSSNPEDRITKTLNRIGNYIVVTTGVSNEQALPIINQIKYTAKVYWEGDNFTAIPLEFRPPDQVALQEASETAVILLRTFYWIGFMIVLAITAGLFAGSCFFYLRRYQRRKSGVDVLFSDAGGTIQLQLDSIETKPLCTGSAEVASRTESPFTPG